MDKTTNDNLIELTGLLFSVKEKLSDQEYIDILAKCKVVFVKIELDNKTKLNMYTKYNKLQERYVKLGTCFTQLYFDSHHVEDEEEEDNPISFVSAM
jgi:hypothetical protein